jgi:hypothetical protein
MAKVLQTAAMVVGGIALAVGTFGVGAGLAAGWTLAASVSAVATTASLGAAFAAAAALEAAGSLLEKKPSAPGNPMEWKADPQAGIPYPMGEGYVGGQIVYRMAYGNKNKWQTVITVHGGGGPHQEFQKLYVDNVVRAIFPGGEVNLGGNSGNMFAATQLGLAPEPTNLNVAPIDPYAWTADCKLSGYAASIITLKYDAKGSHTLTTTPQVGWYGRWARVYDPRRDSSYPGGSGTHRANDESTWEWSANPYLHALTWLIGRRANGHLVLGVGVSLKNVLVGQFVEGANIADANGWTMFGVAMSTDDKWDTLKKILQAGGAVPMRLGGQIGCVINTPRVSLADITVDDIIGDVSVQGTSSRKDRINAIVPRYMGRQSVTTQDSDGNLITSDTYALLPAAPIVVAEYVTFDGGKTRQREVEYSFVQSFDPDLKQVGQLARYDLENAREFGPISLPLRLRWLGYRPGDVVTVTVDEDGLHGQAILLMNRQLDPQTGTVTMTARSETATKHAFALAQTATPPETPSVALPDGTNTYGSTADTTVITADTDATTADEG